MMDDRSSLPSSPFSREAETHDNAPALGDKLHAYRSSACMSQQELAERSGLSVRTISNLECGRTRSPFPNSLRRLADALGLREGARAEFIGAASRRLGRPAASGRPGRTAPAARSEPGESEGSRPQNPVVPRQLPASVPAFAGRRAQLAMLSQVMNVPGGTGRTGGTAAVMTISGTAGIGKTALAVHWAHRVAGQFPDGQLFADLCGFGPSQPPALPATIVRVFLDSLGVPADRIPAEAEAQFGLYRSLLAGKQILVVLDNARNAVQVRPLLPGWPTCRAIVTSRNQLTGLTAIDAARPLALDVLSRAEARDLLAHRLGAERVAADPAAVTRLLRSCAGLPLALCIIAARAAMRPDPSLAQVAADLDARPSLDSFADEDDPAADVRAVFSWSYRQLPADAACAFRLAALHPGSGFDRYAVAALTGTSADQAGQLLDVLARGCMVQPAGAARYSMHDLLRDYARELTASAGSQNERQAALTGLFDYYLHTAVAAVSTAFPAERKRMPPALPASGPAVTVEAAALEWLDTERPSLVAVAVHAAGHGWPNHAVGLSSALFRYLDTSGHYPEALVIHGHAGRAARQIGDRAAEANAANHLGVMDMRLGRYDLASGHFEQALPHYREAGDRTGEARSLANLGFIGFLRGRNEAIGQMRQALDMFRDLGDRAGEARGLASVGFLHLRQGRYEQAADHLAQSAALCRDTRDKGGVARALGNLGEVRLRQGRYEEAGKHLEQALAIFRELGDQISEAEALADLGLVDLRQGRHEQAEGRLRQALDLCRETGDLSSQAVVRNGFGEILLATGRCADARTQYTTALEMATAASERYEQGRAHDGLGSVNQASGAPARARHHWQEAQACYEDLGAPEAGQIRARLGCATTASADC
jgi:tetratricopeptide (TPR) repeat protein/transcriptional regulator with XRE-family HTH domain